LLSLILGCSSGSLIITSRPGKITVAPGEKVTLFCAVDDDYEWCKFYHPDGRFCDFEWKRSKDNITMQECQLADKVGCLLSSYYIYDILVYFRYSFMVPMMTESVGLHLLLGLKIQELGGEKDL
jgi:hypothetical protein